MTGDDAGVSGMKSPAGTSETIARFEGGVGKAVASADLAGARIVVAVSGGPDSLAMLHALHRLRDELDLDLHVAHLDHRLRGEDSAADAQFVANTCAALCVECTVDSKDVLAFQRKHRLSLEEAAREARYDFLTQVAMREASDTIVLGHTSDDQVETVLMNIIRGSGLRGLRGMLPKSTRRISGGDITLFRPLLHLSKGDTMGYCQALGITPRLDDSNTSMELTRNRIRLELLPMLRDLNPEIGKAIERLSQNAGDALEAVELAVGAAWSQVIEEGDDCIRIDREEFRRLDEGLRQQLMFRALARTKGDALGIERGHVQNAAIAVVESPGKRLHLPGSLRLTVEQNAALIYLGETLPLLRRAAPIEGKCTICVPGETIVGEWRITTERSEATAEHLPAASEKRVEGAFVERFGGAVDITSLAVRSREPGDRFQPLGMSGTKKLKDFMIDEKVPNSLRDGVPLVVTSQGIAWVVGWRIAEWAKVDEGERECLQITVERSV